MNAVDEMSPLLSFIERFNQFCAFFSSYCTGQICHSLSYPSFQMLFFYFSFFSVCMSQL